MPRGHAGLPQSAARVLSKAQLLRDLQLIDVDPVARARVLALENDFTPRIEMAIKSLPLADATFNRFRTSPYVLLMQSAMHGYSTVAQIEHDILPAKLFSSMETSTGKMIELATLPHYGWTDVPSRMTTAYSAIDGKKVTGDVLTIATLKSGPVCLNDEMAENFADTIINHARTWASDAGATRVEFTYGVLYGTRKLSNKKDWHILRNLYDKLGRGSFSVSPYGRWDATFDLDGLEVEATIRIGTDWWTYLGGSDRTALEVWTALIRACVTAGAPDPPTHPYVIRDLGSIVSGVPPTYNVSLLQGAQLQWLFFVARHFADTLI